MKKCMILAAVIGLAIVASASITTYFSEYRTVVSVAAGASGATYTLVNSNATDGYYNLTTGVTEDDCATTGQPAVVMVRWTSPDNVVHGVEFDGCSAGLSDQDLALSLKAGTTITADTLNNTNTTGNLKIHAGILGFWS